MFVQETKVGTEAINYTYLYQYHFSERNKILYGRVRKMFTFPTYMFPHCQYDLIATLSQN